MDGSISEDCSLGPESLTMGLPGEGASDLLQVLLNENRLLKENLEESSCAMKLACEKLASANDQFIKERQDFEEKCREAKEVVTALREEVRQKNDLIETMKLQAVQEVKYDKTDNQSVRSQVAVLKKSLESATQERDELKNKYVALEMHLESEVANAEELRNQDRQTIEQLQTTIGSLQKVQAKERNEKQELSNSLDHLRGTFDELLAEYEKLINDEKKNKAALVAKDGQIQNLQLFIQQLERKVLALQTQVQMCRSEFEGERNARQYLNNQYVTLKATLEEWTMPRDGQRFSPAGPSSLNACPKAAGPSSLNAACPKKEVCICPKCGLKAQNIETLYLHTKTCSA